MGTKRRDGSIQSSNLPAYNRLVKNRIDKDYGVYRCMITKVHFVGDPQNTTYLNPQVTYEAIILGGAREGNILQNVKASSDLGGQYNFSERIFRPTSTKNLEEKAISKQDGDIVYIQFLQGNTRAPIIIGAGVSPLDEDFTGSTVANGYIDQRQYNGIYQLIDKNGVYILQRKGGNLDSNSGIFIPNADGNEASFIMQENEIIFQTGNGEVTQTLDGANKKITQKVGGATVTIDGESNQMTVTIGGTTLLVDGDSNTITLSAGFVNLGKSVSDFATLFTQLASAFNSHTHMWPGGNVPAPTTPPLAPLLTTVGSQTVQVQP